MMKILITNYVHPDLITRFKEMGHDVVYDPNYKYDDLAAEIEDYHGLVINTKIKMTREMIDLGKNLKFIGRLGSGLDIIDLEHAAKKNIEVISTPEGNRNAVAEHVFAMLLALNNNIIQADKEIRKGIWEREKNRGVELENKIFGLVGLGNTGQSVAAKLSPWTQQTLYYDKYLLETPTHLSNIESVSIEDLQKRCDIISFHVPLTVETKHMINSDFIKNCKDGVIIINTCRGKVAKTADLIAALETKKLGGLCMDVFENEKTHTYSQDEQELYNRLFQMEKTVFTPHIAGWTHESLQKIANVMADKVQKAFKY